LSTPSTRKYSDYCDSNDETKSVSSINTNKESIYCKTPTNAKKSNDFKVKYKTEKCKFWEINHSCRYGDNCAFAHGNSEMKHKITTPSRFKTKKCKQFYENGFCSYGNRCQFRHLDMRVYSYSKLLKQLYKPDFEVPRLAVFRKMYDENCEECNFNNYNLFDELYRRNDEVSTTNIVNTTSRSRVLSC